MTNNAFRKLCNEWRYNQQYNTEFTDYIIAHAEHPEEVNTEFLPARYTEECNKLRKEFKLLKSYPWLEDSVEVDMYIDLMPFGGYIDFTEINIALKNYRNKRR